MSKLETHLTTVFCEDMRQELSGQITLVGVYNNVCGVESFPVLMPKLAVMLRLIGPPECLPKAVGYKVWLGESLIAEVPVEEPAPGVPPELSDHIDAASAERPEDVQYAGKFASLTGFMSFTPLAIERPSSMRIRAYGPNGEEFVAPGLTFVSKEAFSNNS